MIDACRRCRLPPAGVNAVWSVRRAGPSVVWAWCGVGMVRRYQQHDGPPVRIPGLPPARSGGWRYWIDRLLDPLTKSPVRPPGVSPHPPGPLPPGNPLTAGPRLPAPAAPIREVLWLRIWLSVAAAVLLLAGAMVWRHYQLRHTCERLLSLAASHENAGEDAAAVGHYREVLGLFPERADVHWKLTLAMDRQAKSLTEKRQVLEMYRRNAAAASEYRGEARLRLAELHWEVGQALEALVLANAALESSPHNSRAWRVKGLVLAHRHEAQEKLAPPELIKTLETAHGLNPNDLPLAAGLAGWLRRSQDYAAADPEQAAQAAQRADEVLDRFVAAHAQDPQAHLARFAYRTHFNLPGSDNDLDAALRLSPDNDEILLAAGGQFRRDRLWRAAKALYERLVKLKPTDARGYLGLALTHAAERNLPTALTVARQGMTNCPHDPWLIVQAAGWCMDQGDTAEVQRLLDRLQSQSGQTRALLPRHQLEALEQTSELLQARILIAEKKLNAAVDRLRALSSFHESRDILPDAIVRRMHVHGMLAECLERQLDWYGAAEQLDALAELDPNDAQRWAKAGRLWLRARQPLRASQRLERALSIDPELAGVRDELKALQLAAPK